MLFISCLINIDSLTVTEVDHEDGLSRITIVTSGTPQIIEQIKAQLGQIVPVHEVHDLTVEGPSVERKHLLRVYVLPSYFCFHLAVCSSRCA